MRLYFNTSILQYLNTSIHVSIDLFDLFDLFDKIHSYSLMLSKIKILSRVFSLSSNGKQ